MTASIIPILGLPSGLFPNILPFSSSLNSPPPLNTCPFQFFFLSCIVFTRHLVSFIIRQHPFIGYPILPTYLSDCLQIHISRASNLSISALHKVHVSHP